MISLVNFSNGKVVIFICSRRAATLNVEVHVLAHRQREGGTDEMGGKRMRRLRGLQSLYLPFTA